MSVVTVLVTIMLTWLLLEYSPESPANYILSKVLVGPYSQSESQLYAALINYLNTIRPQGNPLVKGLMYLWNFMHGNFGFSVLTQVPVTTIIAVALPWTILVVSTSILISFFVGVRIGEKIGYKRGAKIDSFFTMLFTIVRSIPIYILGILFLYFLGFRLHLFPTGGAYSATITPGPSLAFVVSVLYHAALPILTLTLINLMGWALQMRANIIYTLGEDYVTFAEIRGISDNVIETKYVGRNSILPLYTSLILSLGFSFGGSVFVESIFNYPGVGLLIYNAVINNDYPVEMATFVIIVLAVVVGVFLADLTYSLLDPRVKQE